MKTQVEMKPCPFCGSSELLQTDQMVVEQTEPPEPEEWFVVCGACSAMGPLSPSIGESIRFAKFVVWRCIQGKRVA